MTEAQLGEDRSARGRVQAILELEGDPSRGEAVFQGICAECHRPSGLGVDDPEEPGIGANLSKALDKPDADLIEVILHGRNQMPSFADVLSNREIADVLAYIREDLFE